MGLLIFIIGVACYFTFFFTFLALIAFVGNLPMHFGWLMGIMPKSIDSLPGNISFYSITINLLFIALFGVQHSIMARQWFKSAITKVLPQSLERSIFVLVSSLILIVMMVFWQPMTSNIWTVKNPIGQTIIWLLFAFGWGLVLFSSFIINHFDLFGLRQTYLAMVHKEYKDLPFQIKSLYKLVRHPLYLGFILGLWAIPSMSAGHLLLSIGFTVYIFIGVIFEERDLISIFGEDYRTYKKKTPMICPFAHHN